MFQNKRLCPRCLIFLPALVLAARAGPVFNVTDYGATGNGLALDSPAINDAICMTPPHLLKTACKMS